MPDIQKCNKLLTSVEIVIIILTFAECLLFRIVLSAFFVLICSLATHSNLYEVSYFEK